MRVCMLAYTFYEADPRVRQYASALVERGDTVDVIALRPKDSPKYDVLDGVNVIRLQGRQVNERRRFQYAHRITRFLFHAAATLAQRHLSDPYQVVHVHSVPDFLVFGALVPKLMGAGILLDIHDLLPELYASKFSVPRESIWFNMMKSVEKASCSFADHVIIANDIWRERLIQRSVPPEKCTTIRNYPTLTLFKSFSRQSHNGKFLITYPGSLNKHQGLEVAIKAYRRVYDRMPNSEFHIYGEGADKPRLIQMARDFGLEQRVIFHAGMSSQEIAQVMVNTDLAVEPKLSKIPFSNEAASTKILEFMAAGVPIVASRTSIHSRYYSDSILKYYDADDDEALATCIFSMWLDPQGRKEQVGRATQYVDQNNWEAKKADYLRLVDKVAGRH
jgi:glycosyltransferase involved in cell wall biosynthesis